MNPPFRLDSVLQLRCRERDQAAKEVADASAAIALLDAKLSEIADEQRRMERARRQSSEGTVLLSQILDAERYQMVLSAQHDHIAKDRSLLVQEWERRRAKLVVRQQAVKALEKLEQNHIDRNAEEERKRHQTTLDEWSQTQTSIATRGIT